jgi:hypothetical protein
MARTQPHHGDGLVYTGECLCHGIEAEGPIARGRPKPYRASLDPFGGPPYEKVVFVFGDRGAHEIPVRGIRTREAVA